MGWGPAMAIVLSLDSRRYPYLEGGAYRTMPCLATVTLFLKLTTKALSHGGDAHEATMRDSGLHQIWLVISHLSNMYDTWNCWRKVVQMWCRSSASPITHQWGTLKKRHNPLFCKGLRSGGYRDRTDDLLNSIHILGAV